MARADNEPELRGISIRDFATICNAIFENGEGDVARYRGRKWNPMGIPMGFRTDTGYLYNGYTLRYKLFGEKWYVECSGSIYPPGNTERGQGHYSYSAFEQVRFSHLSKSGRGQLRYIFGFRLYGDKERYLHDMSLVRFMLPDWERV